MPKRYHPGKMNWTRRKSGMNHTGLISAHRMADAVAHLPVLVYQDAASLRVECGLCAWSVNTGDPKVVESHIDTH